MPSAVVDLHPKSPPIDYAGTLTLEHVQGDRVHRLFTGAATEVSPTQQSIRITAEGGLALVESQMPYLRISGVHPSEVVVSLVEEAGQRIEIMGGLEIGERPLELFVTMTPVNGVTVERPLRVGRVLVLPLSQVQQEVVSAFAEAGSTHLDCVARVFVIAKSLAVATNEALRHLDLAMDTLLLGNLYSFGVDPTGRPIPYSRLRRRSRPRRQEYVFTQGLASRRSWLKGLERKGPAHAVMADEVMARSSWASHSAVGSLALAMAALRIAADEAEHPVQRNQALWNSLEFCTSGVEVPPVVSDRSRSRIKRAVKDLGLEEGERVRALEVLGRMNDPSLLVKIFARAREDNAPIFPEEGDLLRRLRQNRNDSSHGRLMDGATNEDLDRGISLAARLLSYRLYRQRG